MSQPVTFAAFFQQLICAVDDEENSYPPPLSTNPSFQPHQPTIQPHPSSFHSAHQQSYGQAYQQPLQQSTSAHFTAIEHDSHEMLSPTVLTFSPSYATTTHMTGSPQIAYPSRTLPNHAQTSTSRQFNTFHQGSLLSQSVATQPNFNTTNPQHNLGHILQQQIPSSSIPTHNASYCTFNHPRTQQMQPQHEVFEPQPLFQLSPQSSHMPPPPQPLPQSSLQPTPSASTVPLVELEPLAFSSNPSQPTPQQQQQQQQQQPYSTNSLQQIFHQQPFNNQLHPSQSHSKLASNNAQINPHPNYCSSSSVVSTSIYTHNNSPTSSHCSHTAFSSSPTLFSQNSHQAALQNQFFSDKNQWTSSQDPQFGLRMIHSNQPQPQPQSLGIQPPYIQHVGFPQSQQYQQPPQQPQQPFQPNSSFQQPQYQQHQQQYHGTGFHNPKYQPSSHAFSERVETMSSCEVASQASHYSHQSHQHFQTHQPQAQQPQKSTILGFMRSQTPTQPQYFG